MICKGLAVRSPMPGRPNINITISRVMISSVVFAVTRSVRPSPRDRFTVVTTLWTNTFAITRGGSPGVTFPQESLSMTIVFVRSVPT